MGLGNLSIDGQGVKPRSGATLPKQSRGRIFIPALRYRANLKSLLESRASVACGIFTVAVEGLDISDLRASPCR